MIASDLRPMFKRVFTLRFEEDPPYDQILGALKNELNKEAQVLRNPSVHHQFEWCKNRHYDSLIA